MTNFSGTMVTLHKCTEFSHEKKPIIKNSILIVKKFVELTEA